MIELLGRELSAHPGKKVVAFFLTYSSIMPGTAGNAIWPVITDRRYNRRAMDFAHQRRIQ